MSQIRLLAVVAAVGCAAPAIVCAQTAEPSTDLEYDRYIDAALRAFEVSAFAEARTMFEKAHARQPSARTLRGLGVTAAALRRYDLALRELEEALAETRRALTTEQRAEVTELAQWIRTSLPTLRLELTPDDARARVDGFDVSDAVIRLDPGEHTLHVTAAGYQPHTDTFRLEPAEHAELAIALTPLPAAAPEPTLTAPQPGDATSARHVAAVTREPPLVYERWWFWTAVGVAVAGGVAATIAIAANRERSFESSEFGVIRIGRMGK